MFYRAKNASSELACVQYACLVICCWGFTTC